MVGLIGQRDMEGDEVALFEALLQRDLSSARRLALAVRSTRGVQDPHVESGGTRGDGSADPPRADDPERLPVNLAAEELQRLTKAFDSAAIPMMTIKGLALAKTAYGDLELRQFWDIDLLFQPQDIDAISDLLSQLDYHRADNFSSAGSVIFM